MQPPVSPPLPKEDLLCILNETAALWEEARDKRFFITGGTGFFGAWLLESFSYANQRLNLGAAAYVLSRDPDAFKMKMPHLFERGDIVFIKGDIKNFTFPEGRFDFVLHAATEVSPKHKKLPNREILESIVEGMARTLDFARSAKTKKFLFTSSGAIYGQQPSNMTHIPEGYLGSPDLGNPSSAYAEGKRVAELMGVLTSEELGFEFKIARCFAFVGPQLPLNAHFAIGNFIRDAIDKKPINISGSGSTLRSYMYASDLTIWLWKILFSGPSNRAYNVGSEDVVSIENLAKTVNFELGNTCGTSVSLAGLQNTSISQYVPCVERAALEMGLKVTIELGEAIRKTASWVIQSESN